MDDEGSARRYRVCGRVQGVFFRRSAQHEAQRLGLSGWVRNNADGSVEAYAVGASAALRAFEHWLHEGPPHARVAGVETSDAASEDVAGFAVR